MEWTVVGVSHAISTHDIVGGTFVMPAGFECLAVRVQCARDANTVYALQDLDGT